MNRRYRVVIYGFVGWAAAIFVRLVWLQLIHHADYVAAAARQQERVVELPALRATIYDRRGEPLALSVSSGSIFVNPLKLPDRAMAADILAAVLHLDRRDLYGKIQSAYEGHRRFLWIKQKITSDQRQEVLDLRLGWVGITEESVRHYPSGLLAAHILGGVDSSGHGKAGIEQSLDAVLGGSAGRARMLTDVRRRGIDPQIESEPKLGSSITLTIEQRVQYVAERELAVAVKLHDAVSGSVVVMDPWSGDVLALASYPSYDPNFPSQAENARSLQNQAISVPFEPGAVFEVVTFSAAMETTRLRPESLLDCNGTLSLLGGRVIHESIRLGTVPVSEILAKSSNVGVIKIGMYVGQDSLYEYLRRFGFGQTTGIELPAESPGRVRELRNWSSGSLPSVSMGQAVGVTTLQLAQAGSAIANGGLLVRPHLVLRNGAGKSPAQTPARIIRPETAIIMRQMLEGVVLAGTGSAARIDGYSAGGKTGTAEIFDVAKGKYLHDRFNGSFLGFAPVTNPAVVVAVTLNGTFGPSGFGSVAATPVFREVAGTALRTLDIPRDLPDDSRTESTRSGVQKSKLNDLSIAEVGSDLPNILQDDQSGGSTSRAPSFIGMTMRAALEKAISRGITVIPEGSGVARSQNPQPGAPWHAGEPIHLRFR